MSLEERLNLQAVELRELRMVLKKVAAGLLDLDGRVKAVELAADGLVEDNAKLRHELEARFTSSSVRLQQLADALQVMRADLDLVEPSTTRLVEALEAELQPPPAGQTCAQCNARVGKTGRLIRGGGRYNQGQWLPVGDWWVCESCASSAPWQGL